MQGKPTKQQCGSTSALCPSGSAPCSSQCERQVECARQHVVRHAQAAAVVGQAGQATPRAAVQAVAGAAPRMARCLVSIPLHTDMEDRTWKQLKCCCPLTDAVSPACNWIGCPAPMPALGRIFGSRDTAQGTRLRFLPGLRMTPGRWPSTKTLPCLPAAAGPCVIGQWGGKVGSSRTEQLRLM